jgi:hypothetical protein
MQPIATKRGVPVVMLVSAVLVVALLAGCASAARQPPREATVTPHASASPHTPAGIHAATLGGTINDFQTRYQVVAGTQNFVYDATIAGQRVEITLGPDLPQQSLDGVAHIAVVTLSVPADALRSEQWSAALADQVAQPFLPADAQLQHSITVNGAPDHIYTSASIAATFTPDQFVTDANAPVPLGTFDDLCRPLPLSNTGIEQCTIAIGSN